MATNKKLAPNIDNSDLVNYPDGRIRDNSGAGDGTPVNRLLYGDIHEFFAKLMREAQIEYSGLPDNETNGHQLVQALTKIAVKNNFILTMNSVGGIIEVPILLGILKNNESLIFISSFDYSAESNIKGLGSGTKSVTVPSNFKSGEYVRLIVTNAGITLIRITDSASLNAMSSELGFLKSASEAEEYAGTSPTKATTPYSNQLAFFRRVCGIDSAMFLASVTRNGLLSKEDKAIINNLGANPVRNIGWFSGFDPGHQGQSGSQLPRSGNVVSAMVQSVAPGPNNAGSSIVIVTMQNPMSSIDYYVRIFVESEGNIEFDNDVWCPVFKKVSNTQFSISMQEGFPSVQNLKIHIEAVQIQ